jgi:hypothetical protein
MEILLGSEWCPVRSQPRGVGLMREFSDLSQELFDVRVGLMREFSLGPLFRKPSVVDSQPFENLVATKTEAVVERASYSKGCIVPTLAGDRRLVPDQYKRG